MKHSSCLAHYFFLWKIARYKCIIIIIIIIIKGIKGDVKNQP